MGGFITHSIEEAVFLSDRVIVLSPRPFVALVDRIRQLFQAQGILSET